MDSYNLIRYSVKLKNIWDTFVVNSKNGTFLHLRDFMEYHKDRFEDYSLLVFKDKTLIAVLPANKEGNSLHSHQGLTYGGLIIKDSLRFKEVLECFKLILKKADLYGFKFLNIKITPSIYNKKPSDEINYILFLLNGERTRADVLSVIDLREGLTFSKSRIEGCKRADKHRLEIIEANDFEEFWNNILIPNLKAKHSAKPIHSLSEIKLLKNKFPNNIRQFNVYYNEIIVAGATIFETETVAHIQYISATKEKSVLGSLDFLFSHLITKIFIEKKYFDFGISNINQGRNVNEGLQFWKEGFGARSIIQEFYKVNTENHYLLDKVMI